MQPRRVRGEPWSMVGEVSTLVAAERPLRAVVAGEIVHARPIFVTAATGVTVTLIDALATAPATA